MGASAGVKWELKMGGTRAHVRRARVSKSPHLPDFKGFS